MVGYKLSNVVKEHLIEIGEQNANKYARFLQIAVAGLREIRMDVSGTPTTVQIAVTDHDTVALPKDYIQYVRIATVDSQGNISEMGLNSSMTLKRVTDNCGNPQISIPPTNSTDSETRAIAPNPYLLGWDGFSDHFRNGEVMGRFFGIGGGNNANGYYRVDKENGYIQISNTRAAFIVLEYLADISLCNDDFMVDAYLLEPLKAWIYWKSIQRNIRVGLGEKQTAKQDYIQARRLALSRYNSNTPQEWLSAFRTGNKAAVKW